MSCKFFVFVVEDFNCTIQELKQVFYKLFNRLAMHFNCTIQELKRRTPGILFCFETHFNCTIQELKLQELKLMEVVRNDFNCTIQELKQFGDTLIVENLDEFQLHHTGIKTLHMEDYHLLSRCISIAPYRN